MKNTLHGEQGSWLAPCIEQSQFRISVVASILKQPFCIVKALTSILFIDPHKWMDVKLV